MSEFNLNTNHPLIPNANQYYLEKKYISIHSEDRNILKYPNASEFEIELPQDYLNVQSVKLSSWSFPANYNVFSAVTSNITMSFKFVKLYNPGEFGIQDTLTEAVFAGLYENKDTEILVSIETGFYNPEQMAIELTNKFNEAVTKLLRDFFTSNPDYNIMLNYDYKYDRFVIVYNAVGQKLWFGNNADQFVLTNDSSYYCTNKDIDMHCPRKGLPNSESWGLPAYLGFTRHPVVAVNIEGRSSDVLDPFITTTSTGLVPRFYYGDVTGTGDDGYWLLPTLANATVYFLQAPYKINFMGPAYIYMEIAGMNCIDETSPFNVSKLTTHTNETNGRVTSAFAKIPVTTTPIAQWFDQDMIPYKYFYPPAERIRRLKIKFRYHDGQLVDFGTFDYSFTIEFCVLRPQQERTLGLKKANNLEQIQYNKFG
jgi:hypothetical protein